MTSELHPSFQIAEFENLPSVIGRNCGAPIHVGTVFTRIVRQDFSVSTPGEIRHVETVLAEGTEIRVVEIEWYRFSVETLDHGHTARLMLAGAGLENLFALQSSLGEKSYLALECPPR